MNKKGTIIAIIVLVIVVAAFAIIYLINNNGESSIPTSSNEELFSLKYNGVEIVPGTEFNENAINEENSVSEIPSCAFDGTDKVYTYPNVEITVAKINEKDTVYSVYFINDLAETAEGVKISDSKNTMLEKYGDKYEEVLENKYTYTKNNVELSFIVENDTITGIDYTLKTNN